MIRGIPITKNGKEKIEKELTHLITVERESLKKAISEARALGDLKENAEYHSAKEKQAQVEGKIMQLQGVLASANVIEPSKIESETVVFGATVTLFDLDKETSSTYQIVGHLEADSTKGKISIDAPLAKALIGKKCGDNVVVKAPKGDVEYEIENIQFLEG